MIQLADLVLLKWSDLILYVMHVMFPVLFTVELSQDQVQIFEVYKFIFLVKHLTSLFKLCS